MRYRKATPPSAGNDFRGRGFCRPIGGCYKSIFHDIDQASDTSKFGGTRLFNPSLAGSGLIKRRSKSVSLNLCTERAVQEGHEERRPDLLRELVRLSKHYGIIAGSAGSHPNRDVEQELRHLRTISIDAHRPLTLRVINDLADPSDPSPSLEEVCKTLRGIGTWITRLWLADRATAGLNSAVVDLAHGRGPDDDVKYSEHWIAQIRKLRSSRIGVPTSAEVRDGIARRKAYGGSATRTTFAILCALMESEHSDPSPPRERLTIEHIMPRKLTQAWSQDLGEHDEEIHGKYRNLLANLTLSGDRTNPSLGTDSFVEKCKVYRDSPIGLTRRIANFKQWGSAEMDQRAEDLAKQVLEHWSWHDGPIGPAKKLRWRIGRSPWRMEASAAKMALNVAGELLTLDPRNVDLLSGTAKTRDIHLAQDYPPGTMVGGGKMREIPGHSRFVLYPYQGDPVAFCRGLGSRCGIEVEIAFDGADHESSFWQFLKEHHGGVPGQKDHWNDNGNQWTPSINVFRDSIGFYVGNPEYIWLYMKSGQPNSSAEGAARMREYSRELQVQLADQELSSDVDRRSAKGQSVHVRRRWIREDKREWPDTAFWLMSQFERLCKMFGYPTGTSWQSSSD